MSGRIPFAVRILAVVALSGCATLGTLGEEEARKTTTHASEPDAATACVYLTRHDGARYALAYAGRGCTREGYLALPVDLYDPVASWASHAQYTGIVSALDRYRILARLATRDERSEHGNYGIHGLFTRWSHYKWAEHTRSAYYATTYALGRQSAIAQSLETSLLRLRFATKKDDVLVPKERKLSVAEKADLLVLLATTEVTLGGEERMRAVRRTLEEATRAASPDFEERMRRDLGMFRLE